MEGAGLLREVAGFRGVPRRDFCETNPFWMVGMRLSGSRGSGLCRVVHVFANAQRSFVGVRRNLPNEPKFGPGPEGTPADRDYFAETNPIEEDWSAGHGRALCRFVRLTGFFAKGSYLRDWLGDYLRYEVDPAQPQTGFGFGHGCTRMGWVYERFRGLRSLFSKRSQSASPGLVFFRNEPSFG